jgi:hypothetical protein
MFADFIDWRFQIGPVEGFVILIAVIAMGFVIWMLVDAIGRRPEDYPSPGSKTGWIAGLIIGLFFGFAFLGLIVAIAYLFVVKIPGGRRTPTPAWTAPPPVSAPPGGTPMPGAPMPPPPMNCRNCGTRLPTGARFCHSCGTPVE